MSKMMTPELEVTRFANEDVIATSFLQIGRTTTGYTVYYGNWGGYGSITTTGSAGVGQAMNAGYGRPNVNNNTVYVHSNGNDMSLDDYLSRIQDGELVDLTGGERTIFTIGSDVVDGYLYYENRTQQ